MKKLMIAAASAVALGFSALATQQPWFNGGIATGWPTATSLSGGAWSNTDDSSFETDKVIVDADEATPLTFTATTAKDVGATCESFEINSTIVFTPFAAVPAVPSGAKAGLIIVGDDASGYKYYGLANTGSVDKVETAWVELDEATDVTAAKAITVSLSGAGLAYKVGGTQVGGLQTAISKTGFQYVNYTGNGEVSKLEATADNYVEPTMIIIGNATYEQNSDGSYTFMPALGYSIGSIMINGEAKEGTLDPETGYVTVSFDKYTAAQDIVVATKKVYEKPDHVWYEGIGVIASNSTPTVAINTDPANPGTSMDFSAFHGALVEDYFVNTYSTGGKAVDLWKVSELLKKQTGVAEWSIQKTNVFEEGTYAGNDMRGAGVSPALNVALAGNYSTGDNAFIYSMPLNAAPVFSGDGVNAWKYELMTNDVVKVNADAFAFSPDGKYVFSNFNPAQDEPMVAKWRILNGLKGEDGGLQFIGIANVGTRVRTIAYAKVFGKDYVFAMLNGDAGVVAVDMTSDDPEDWATTKIISKFDIKASYGTLCVSGVAAGTPHLTVAGSINSPLNEFIAIYNLAETEGVISATILKTYSKATLEAAGFGTLFQHCNSIGITDDESTLIFSHGVKGSVYNGAIGGSANSWNFAAQYCAPAAINVTPADNATYALTVNGAAVKSGDTFEAGAVYTVVATPNKDYKYAEEPAGWTLAEGVLTKTGTLGIAEVNITIPAPVLDQIEFTLTAPANTTVTKVMNGEEELTEPYKVVPGTTVTVTYTANEGYLFADGTTSTNADVTVSAAGTQPAPAGVVVQPGKAKIGTTYYLTLDAAVKALTGGETIVLVQDVTQSELLVLDKAATLDLNGKTLTLPNGVGITVQANLKVVNGVAGQGGLSIAGEVFASGAAIDLWDIAYGAGGLIQHVGGCIKIDGTGSVKFMSAWAGESANALNAYTPGFFSLSEGAKVVTGKTYTWNGSIFTMDGAIAAATITRNGATFVEVFASLADAIAAANVDTTVTLGENVTLDATLTINKAITVDLNGKTVTLSDAQFGIVIDADATVKNGSIKSALTANVCKFAFYVNPGKSPLLKDLAIDASYYEYGLTCDSQDFEPLSGAYEATPTSTVTCENVDVTGNGTLIYAQWCNVTLDANCSAIRNTELPLFANGAHQTAIYSVLNATVTINGGTYTHVKALLSGNLGAKIIANGGTFNGQIYSWMQVGAHSELETYDSYKAQFALNGGTYTDATIAFQNADSRSLDVFTKHVALADTLAAPTGYKWDLSGSVYTLVADNGPSLDPDQGTIAKKEGSDDTYVVTPAEGTNIVSVSGLPDAAKVEIAGLKVDVITGVTADKVVITNTTAQGYDISAAFKAVNVEKAGGDPAVQIVLDETASVKIGDETIPVKPVVDTEAEKPVEITTTQASVATRTIPGLTYQLVRGTEVGSITDALETEGAKKTATGTDTSLVDTAKPSGKAFYKIQVTK